MAGAPAPVSVPSVIGVWTTTAAMMASAAAHQRQSTNAATTGTANSRVSRIALPPTGVGNR